MLSTATPTLSKCKQQDKKSIFKAYPYSWTSNLCKIILSFYRGRIKSVYNLLGNNFHVICGGNHFNFITDHCVKFKGSVIALVVILIHEFRMETFKKPKKKVYSKREVFFPPMMYIYYLYMFFMISFIYLKSHALR